MKIKSFTLKNIKNFKDEITFDLNDKLNILIGPNGGGKSNFLEAIAVTFTTINKQYRINNLGENQPKTIRVNETGHSRDQYQIFTKNLYAKDQEQVLKMVIMVEADDFKTPKLILENWDNIVEKNEKAMSIVENIENWVPDFKTKLERLITAQTDIQDKTITLEFGLDNGFPVLLENKLNPEEKSFIYYLYELERYRVLMYLLREILGEGSVPYIPSVTMLYISPTRALSMPTSIDLRRVNSNEKYANSNINMYAQQTESMRQVNSIDYLSPALNELIEEYYNRKWNQEGEDPELKSDFFQNIQEAIKESLGFQLKVEEVNPPISYSFKVRTEDGQEINVNDLSSGEKQLIYLIFALYAKDAGGGILIIDEPELHLHKKFQIYLIKLLKQLSSKGRNYQIVLSTHSPTVVSEKTLESVIRIYKDNKTSQKAVISKTKSVSLKDELLIINTQNNERIFFADKVILVEGTIDKLVINAILEAIIKHYSIRETVEIIEVNGKANFKRYREFLSNFNISNYIIGDFDYITNISEIQDQVSELFEVSSKKIDEIMKDKDGKDHESLISVLEEATSANDLTKLSEILDYLKSRGKHLKKGLEKESIEKLKVVISELNKQGTYVLYSSALNGEKGSIENYLPIGYSDKDLDKLAKLVTSQEFTNHLKGNSYQVNELISTLYEILGLEKADITNFLDKLI